MYVSILYSILAKISHQDILAVSLDIVEIKEFSAVGSR